MWWRSGIGWACGLWAAAGVQAAWGCGTPGPLMMVAIAAGLWSGPTTGALVGAGAGLCDAALSGRGLVLWMALGIACGSAASLLARGLSRHWLVALLAAGAASLLIAFALGLLSGQPAVQGLLYAARRAGANLLWMIPIYGIVVVVSWSGSRAARQWE